MKIVCLKNGPYLINGALQLTDEAGNVNTLKDGSVALCRCGHSGNKPFCDGAHKAIQFEADLVEIDERENL